MKRTIDERLDRLMEDLDDDRKTVPPVHPDGTPYNYQLSTIVNVLKETLTLVREVAKRSDR